MKKPLIPFSCMPGSWGLKGKTRLIAKAEYELTGEQLERALADIESTSPLDNTIRQLKIDIKYDLVDKFTFERKLAELELPVDSQSLKVRMLEIDRMEGKITEFDFRRRLIELTETEGTNSYVLLLAEVDLDEGIITQAEYDRLAVVTLKDKDSEEYKIELLDIDKREGRITELEYQKGVASAKGIGWVGIPTVHTTKDSPQFGSLELDWNDEFIRDLKAAGYNELDDESIVNSWLSDLCKNIAMEQFSGVGDFDERIETKSSRFQKTRRGDGTWEAS